MQRKVIESYEIKRHFINLNYFSFFFFKCVYSKIFRLSLTTQNCDETPPVILRTFLQIPSNYFVIIKKLNL